MNTLNFQDFIKHPILLQSLHKAGYTTATAIQMELIPAIETGENILAIAPTGSGKTEAFVIPLLLAQLNNTDSSTKKVLILSPTRELAIQTNQRIERLTEPLSVKSMAIYGGITYAQQQQELANNPAFIVATPGRLLDLHQQGFIDLSEIEAVVVDEADQMLELGFQQDIHQLLGLLATDAQRIFVSATLAPEIEKLAKKQLKSMREIRIEEAKNLITEQLLFVDKNDKKDLIAYLLETFTLNQVLIFTRTTHAVDRIVKNLETKNIVAKGLYADKSQASREEIVRGFRAQEYPILVATDVATRGIDIPNLPAIINYEIPDNTATYLHRIGRTGRRQAGTAFTFCDGEDNNKLIQLQIELKKSIPVYDQHPYPLSWQKMQTSSNKPKKKRR